MELSCSVYHTHGNSMDCGDIFTVPPHHLRPLYNSSDKAECSGKKEGKGSRKEMCSCENCRNLLHSKCGSPLC